MAERDMTGEERPDRPALPADMAGPDPAGPDQPGSDLVGPDPAPGLARRRAGDPPRIGRLGFEGFAADLAGLAGGAGDLANLPPWSVRDDKAGDRPDRDPVALAAWRRVAERRRLRAGVEPVGAGMEVVEDIPAADVPDVVRAEVVGDLADDDRVGQSAWTEGAGHHMAGDRAEVPVDEDAVDLVDSADPVDPVAEAVDHDDAEPSDGFVNEFRPEEVPADLPGDEVDEPPVPAASTSEGRPEGGPPPARGPGAPAARGGRDPRPGTPPTARPDQGGRHEVLLSLAGRIDDDALSSVRDLVAVEDDAAAAELLGGCLLAAGAGVTAREHAVLGRWFAASRVDPELVDVLPRDPEADRREEHRFTPDPPASARESGSSRDAGEAVARAAARLPGVQRVRQCWRTTPAGSAPGPVPHRVVLVETHSADDCEHVAHHVAHAARELGAVSVEVFAAGAELPAYHRAAVRVARPLGAAASSSSVSETAPLGPPVGAPRPAQSPPPRRAEDEVPPFGVPSAPSAGSPSFLTVTGPDEGPPAEPHPEERSGDEQYRIVAAAGPDPLERERAREHHVEADAPRLDVPEPDAPPEPETVAPEEPAPVDLDPEATAERIAALWRTPPPDEILSDEHPISSWAETSLGVSFGPGPEDPIADVGSSPVAGSAPAGPSVDPDAATGEFPAVAGPATGVDVPATNGVDLPGANGEARVRRARHSRSETGEFEAPVVDTPAPAPPTPPARTNGHHHGAERPDASGDAVTGPVRRPAEIPAPPTPPSPAPAVGSSGPDSVDSQLSDRERELLARLHEELASRERLEADAPDPLTGRPVAPPAGSEDATAPRPRPMGPHPGPGRPPGPPPGPPGGTNGHRPVNGHGLPPRRDQDSDDGASPGA
ncbi:hypothetical protein [Actinomycetospora chibensis]|uniref:Syndecan 1 n=1 Tax=Actinomycetospora chibensis TaxID=663606 RepID=A0ABV9RDH2_9PSEU|nr:hypothetical protein [Actinomycetospora chibensis]MDD7923916.1 hypothetical protein [Actinomycetospora chibensis]